MECGDLKRTGVDGFERGFVINIDHHLGNSMYGALNWFDATAAACGELVFDLIRELRVPLTHEIATHIYIAILTDTGSFHYSSISPRTFDICRQCVEAGVDPPAVARAIFDSNNLGRLKLFGAVLSQMDLDTSGRVATVYVDGKLREETAELRGYRGVDQPAADVRRSRGSLLQGERAGRLGVSMRSRARWM